MRNAWLIWAACTLATCLAACTVPVWAGEKADEGQALDPKLQKLLEKAIEEAKANESRSRFLSDHHTKAGIDLFSANHFEQAKVEFEKALQFDKNNKQAQDYLRRTDTLLGLKRGQWGNIVEEAVNRNLIALQMAKVEMENRFEGAKAAFLKGEYEEAISSFERVREIIKWIEPYADVSQWKANTTDYLARAKKGLREKEEEQAKRKLQKATEIARLKQHELEAFEKNRVETLLAAGRRLYSVGRFDAAREKFQGVVDIDPENDEAKQLAENARIAGMEAWATKNAKRRGDDAAVCWELVEEFSIPQMSPDIYRILWYDVDKWFSRVITRTPVIVGERSGEDQPWKVAINEKLQQPVSFDFIDTPLEDVVQFLRHLTDLTIVLDPQAIEGLESTDITLKVTDMKLEAALNWILKLVNLEYTLKDNAVFISTADAVKGDAIRKLYDVTDLTFEIQDFPGDLRHLRTRTGTSVTGGGSSGEEDEIFGGPEEDEETEEELGRRLVDFIKKTIAPDSWRDDLLDE